MNEAWKHNIYFIRVLALAAGLLLPVLVLAADAEYLQTEQDGVRPISFRSFSGWTEMMFRGSTERADEYRIKETLFSPRLQLSTQGAVYHEKFLSFNLNAMLSIEQQKAWGGNSKSDVLSFNDYNTSVLFFGEKPANLRLFARRNNAWLDSPFRASYRVLGSSMGAEFRIRKIPVPLSVSYNRQRREEILSGTDRIEEQDQVSVNLRNKAGHLNNILTFRYLDYTKNVQFQDYQTLSASLNSTLHFRKHSPGSLRSTLRYFHQYGTIARRDFSVFENLFFNLTKHLEHSVNYQFTEQGSRNFHDTSNPLQLNRSHMGNVGLQHTLYGSLISGFQVYGSYEEFLKSMDGSRQRIGDDKRRGMRADLSYRRMTPWGRLLLGYGVDFAHEEQTATERSRQVSNEEHVLQDGNEPQLEHSNIDSTSIVVTDDTGFTVYQEGLDYTIVRFGRFVKIFRVPGGNITNGQIIFVDYIYTFSPNLAFDTRSHRVNFRFESIKNISLYYRFNRTKENFVSGIPNGFLEDHIRHLAGLNYKAGKFNFGEEYEINDYLDARFVSNRIRADMDSKISRTTRIHFNVNYTLTRFTDVDRTLHVYMVSSRIITMIPGGMHLESEGWLRFDRGNRSDPSLESDYSGVRAKLMKDLKALSFVLGVFYRNADDNQVKDERANVYISIRRSF